MVAHDALIMPMNPLSKWLLACLAALLLAVAVLIVAVTTLVDAEQYQALIIEQVRERTGRDLQLEGTAGLELLPCCAVRIDKATLGNPPGFPAEPFLHLDSARLALRLWPLLTRRTVEIGSVTVDGLQANLLVRQDGSDNWSFGGSEAGGPDTASGARDSADFSVASIELKNATLSYTDEADGSRYRIEQLNASTGPMRSNSPFDLQASLRVAGIEINLEGHGGLGGKMQFDGTLHIVPFSPRELLSRLAAEVPDTADPSVLGKMSGSSDWSYTDEAVGLRKLDLQLDDSRITGELSRELLPAQSTQTPRTRLDVHIDRLDLDRYLEPEQAAGETDASTTPSAESSGPSDLLRELNLEGRARIGQLGFDGLKLGDTDIGIRAARGQISLDPLKSRLYGGESDGEVHLDASGDPLRLKLNQKLTGVDVGALLKDFAEVENMDGTMSFSLKGSSSGNSGDALMQNLTANLSFSMDKGVYRGMDIWYEIRRAHAVLKRSTAPVRTGAEETPIDSLQLSGSLRNGTLNTDSLVAEIPFLRVSGKAAVDVQARTLKSELEALVHEKPVFEDGSSLPELQNVRIPFTLSGAVADPKVRVDLSRMIKGTTTEALKDTVRKKLFEKFGIGTAPD
jgi:AsmA protein